MKVRKVVDLSVPITQKTPVFPGDPKPQIQSIKTFEKDGYHLTSINLGSHTGTHVDAPYHFFEDGQTIDELPLRQFMGRGVILDVRGKQPGMAIGLDDVHDRLEIIEAGDIVIFHTGWSQFAGTERYFTHPYIDIMVIEELLERGVRAFFIDALNVDPPDGSSYKGHRAILGAKGVIGENLYNLEQIDFPHPFIMALPLNLPGVDGSPVRAIALDLESD